MTPTPDKDQAALADEREAVNKLRLEVGTVTDGGMVPLEDEAIIFFVGDDGSCEIRANAPNALHIASRIVELWNVASPKGIYQYGSDTLSGRADGPDDRDWQRAGVLKMTRLARAALAAAHLPQVAGEPVAGETRVDLQLEPHDGENGEAFKNMAAHIWAAGASLEDADFITRMLTRKGLYLFQTEPWKRCPSSHCERRGECSGARDCTIKCPAPLPSGRDAVDPVTVEADDLEILVSRFSARLLAKLKLARANGRSGWERDDWEADCQRGLLRHLEKGDPRDVAVYCAFMDHHGWITKGPRALSQVPASTPATVEGETIERCAEVVANMRQSEAGLFDAKHSGQRGCDRADALFDAYTAIRALSASPQVGGEK